MDDRPPLLLPLRRSVAQLLDPVLRRALVLSVTLAAACFAALIAAGAWALGQLAAGTGQWGWITELAGGVVGGFAMLLLAVVLFLPLCLVIGGFFLEPICDAVERRWYPDLPPAQGAGWGALLREAVVLTLWLLLISLIALPLSLVPGLAPLLGWGIGAYAMGRGFFMSVALRRATRRQALALYTRDRTDVLIQGLGLAVLGAVPGLNLLVPVLGPAVMLHVLARCR